MHWAETDSVKNQLIFFKRRLFVYKSSQDRKNKLMWDIKKWCGQPEPLKMIEENLVSPSKQSVQTSEYLKWKQVWKLWYEFPEYRSIE